MARKKNYYHSYRGRGAARVLKILVLLLLILFVGVLGFYVWAQRYLVYTSNGARFEFPFLQHEEEREEPDLLEEENQLLILDGEPVPDQEEETDQEEAEPLRAVEVTAADLVSGGAAGLVEGAEGNALLVEMKGVDGKLAYVSALDLAVESGASGGDLRVNQAVTALKEKGLYLIARVQCFEDDLLPMYDSSLAILTNSGYRWQGPDGLRWVCPADERVTEYLVGICGELAALGFDEILLDSAGYPGGGNLNYIKVGERYDASQLSQVIGDFYSQAAQRVDQEGSVLSVVTDAETVQTGENALTGQTLETLTEHMAHCWLAVGTEGEEALPSALTEAVEEPERLLVLMDAGDGAEDAWNRAKLLAE